MSFTHLRSNNSFLSLLLLCNVTITAVAQQGRSATVNIGDAAPPLRVREWIKGQPVTDFERGKVYVVEFWATWCGSCIAAMPHLSELANEYKDKVTVVAIDVYEHKNTSITQVKHFVQKMGNRMDFHVAVEDTNFTIHDWIEATGEKDSGIPRTFVVNAEGKLAWIGHPKDIDEVLPKIVNNNWDIKAALSKRLFNKYLDSLDGQSYSKLHKYKGDYYNLKDLGRPDSSLIIIDELIKKEPMLKYAPVTASFTFSALLRTDPHAAYKYGKEVIVTHTYDDPAYDFIIGDIKGDSRKMAIPAEIYRLGAECYQAKINNDPYPELDDIPALYNKMAAWYELAGDTLKAKEAEQKAIKYKKSSSN